MIMMLAHYAAFHITLLHGLPQAHYRQCDVPVIVIIAVFIRPRTGDAILPFILRRAGYSSMQFTPRSVLPPSVHAQPNHAR